MKRFSGGLFAAVLAVLVPSLCVRGEEPELEKITLGKVSETWNIAFHAPKGLKVVEGFSRVMIDNKEGNFQIEIVDTPFDMAKKKKEIKEDKFNVFKKFHVESDNLLVYEASPLDVKPEFHFLMNVKVGDKVFAVNDMNAGKSYTKNDVEVMVECVKTMRPKDSKDAPNTKAIVEKMKNKGKDAAETKPEVKPTETTTRKPAETGEKADDPMQKLFDKLQGNWSNHFAEYLVEFRYEPNLKQKVLRGTGVVGKGTATESRDEITLGWDADKKSYSYHYVMSNGTVYKGTAELKGDDLTIDADATAGPAGKYRTVITFLDKKSYTAVCYVNQDGKLTKLWESQMWRKD